MSKASLAPESKREEQLVALGRSQGRSEVKNREKQEETKEEIADLKKDRNELRRQRDDAELEAENGRASQRLVMGLTGAVGTGTGFAAQHYGMDKTSINPYVKKGTIPGLGLVLGGVSLMVGGIPGSALVGFFLGNAFGSGVTSLTKKVAGIS